MESYCFWLWRHKPWLGEHSPIILAARTFHLGGTCSTVYMLPFEQAVCLQQPSALDKSHIVLTLLPSIAIPDLEDRLFSLKFYFGYFTYVDLLVSVCVPVCAHAF